MNEVLERGYEFVFDYVGGDGHVWLGRKERKGGRRELGGKREVNGPEFNQIGREIKSIARNTKVEGKRFGSWM